MMRPSKRLMNADAEQLHEAREHDQVDLALGKPVRELGVPGVAVRTAREDARLDSRARRPLEPAGLGAVRCHAHDLDGVTAVHRVEDRLQVAALARDEDGHAEGRHYAA